MRSLIDPVTEHYLKHMTRIGSRILEIGCGSGQYRLVVNGEYVGIDVSSEREYKSGVLMAPDVLAEALSLPFRNETFDLVLFVNVVFYFGNPEKAVQESKRVLRPTGRLLIFDYSLKTVERLRLSYLESWQGVNAYPKKCDDWVNLLSGLKGVHLSFKSLRIRPRLLDLILPRRLYYRWIDDREAPIVLTGQKP